MATRFPRRELSVARQITRMREAFAGFACTWRCGLACWRGLLQPTDLSCQYETQISYRLGQWPKVRILNPPIRKRADGGAAPHRYADGTLCLFRPKYGEWSSGLAIADTIVPWTALWLYYYEVWLATGEWVGGGEHPPPRKQPSHKERHAH